MTIDNFEFKNGLTVKELKEIIKDWPDKNRYDEPNEVWIETGRDLTSPITYISRLNMTDLLFESNAFE